MLMSIIRLILRRRFPHRHGGFQDQDFHREGCPQARLARVSPPRLKVSVNWRVRERTICHGDPLGDQRMEGGGIGEVGRRTIELRSMVCGIYMTGRHQSMKINKLLLLTVTTMVRIDHDYSYSHCNVITRKTDGIPCGIGHRYPSPPIRLGSIHSSPTSASNLRQTTRGD
ncbi:hypothetical protein P168DRAFT_139724 [Aspergillus campestris IBT 28561]|uniref:Uncharacterized protein n=1 Tax=Aspergillus campestris (strain IBT 28561) TaxID=1392248 RepID=A0A2I1D4L4_ASPC2|nr:uncharacterized protein P168DRAFT_139724 [Aspergillus campestris IBT 28561]PKY04806.1 hypothetical protein P168DRAFT_139724 [Aspergillus campestris IBT 28561]